jgi:hypothetical protein
MLLFFSASSPYAFEDGVLIGLDEAAAMLEHFLPPLQLPLLASFLSGLFVQFIGLKYTRYGLTKMEGS